MMGGGGGLRVSHRLPLTPVPEGIVPSIGSEDVGRSVMVDSTPPPGATSGRIAGHMHTHYLKEKRSDNSCATCP
jgi:hypothetical protein